MVERLMSKPEAIEKCRQCVDTATPDRIASIVEKKRGIIWPTFFTAARMASWVAFRPVLTPVTTTIMLGSGSSLCWPRDKFRLPLPTIFPTWRNGCP